MEQEPELPGEEKFSDDPEENLRLENNFLKMKMMAESGGIFGGSNDSGLPPEIENQWLKNVMEFEKAYANAKPQKIIDLLGKPAFGDEKGMDDNKFKAEFARLNKLLVDHDINVDFLAPQPDKVKYYFITRELFEHETDFIPVKGMTTNFIYEEFHPDHKNEITKITDDFMNDFFDRKLNIDTHYINDDIIIPDGNVITKEQLINRFYSMYEVAVEFENTSFQIDNIEFEVREEMENGPSGMGFSEGKIQYDMIFKDGERKKIHGPFKIYFGRKWQSWTIYFFYLAGYNLHPKEKE
ncbi:MAG: hypothetical protein ABI472_09455 [Ginsengibacter sp.]